MNDIYLFSIDLEDVRFQMEGGRRYAERVPDNTRRYLAWLKGHSFHCTFFAAGDVAEAYPGLIREILDEGHELGCHTSRHVPLDRMTPAEFRTDLESNVDALRRAGAKDVQGFRAPIFSLVEKTAWAYGVLKELGFAYSSSVLPAKNPFYGWPEFGPAPKRVDGIWELPMTVARIGPYVVPAAGGVYFRVLPRSFVMRAAARARRSDRPLLGYCHPYDIDTAQERFMHPDIDDSRSYNYLMYYNRKSVFPRLDAVLKKGFRIVTYAEFVGTLPAVIPSEARDRVG
jgi:polysaccharide deacetylase family protein (PEP-CTERM system associated)